jgi:arsenite-transporting ATPase
VISQTFTGRYAADAADDFLQTMKADLANGRQLLQDHTQTACLVVAIAEPMSFLETQRFLDALQTLAIPCGGLFINHLLPTSPISPSLLDRLAEQHQLLQNFLALVNPTPVWTVREQPQEPVGAIALDTLIAQIQPAQTITSIVEPPIIQLPEKCLPSLSDFVTEERRLLLIGGKGGVGKTTVAAAIAWSMAQQHPDRSIQVISIDPAHSLGDAFGQPLSHKPVAIAPNLTGQEVDAEQVLDQFRADYLWELAEMMSGDSGDDAATLQIAYGPAAWRKIVAQALPGIDEMLSLITVMELLESRQQDLIILDTAPTGHLLRFLEMPTALGDWLAWIFKLWIKYQDVVGRVELMGRLRTLRQRVMQAQKLLKDPQHTEFIGVAQNQSAILAEAQRLTASLEQLGIAQRYLIHNRYEADQDIAGDNFPQQTIVRLPNLPRSITPLARIQLAAQLLF